MCIYGLLTHCYVGADQIIDYKSTDFETELKGHEVDAVFDTIGGDTLNKVRAFLSRSSSLSSSLFVAFSGACGVCGYLKAPTILSHVVCRASPW